MSASRQLARCQIRRDDEYDMRSGSEASRLTKFVPFPQIGGGEHKVLFLEGLKHVKDMVLFERAFNHGGTI